MLSRIKLALLRLKLRSLVKHEEELRLLSASYVEKSRRLLRTDIPDIERLVSYLEAKIYFDDGGFA